MRRTLFIVVMGASVTLLAGCGRLEKRISALEKVSVEHTAQLSKTFAAEAHLPTSVELPYQNMLVLASLDLPPGSYVISSQVFGSTRAHPIPYGVGCELDVKDADGTIYQIGGSNAGLAADAFELSPVGAVNLATNGVATIQCKAPQARSAIVDWAILLATGFPRVLIQPDSSKATR